MTGAQPAALQRLCEVFGLSPFECDVLLLCAGIELDGRFATLCSGAQGDPTRPWPTFALALAALDDAHWSALLPQGPLRRWRLIELSQGNAITTTPLHIDESVLHYLTDSHRPTSASLASCCPSMRRLIWYPRTTCWRSGSSAHGSARSLGACR